MPSDQPDTTFKPYITTPCFPSYPSNHASGSNGASDVQPGSAAVDALPSVAASGMALNGRQNLYRNFASQTAMPASAIAMFSSANSLPEHLCGGWRAYVIGATQPRILMVQSLVRGTGGKT